MALSTTFPHSSRPSALTVYIAIVGAIGFAIIGHCLYRLAYTPNPMGWLAIGALALVAGKFALKVPGAPMYLSISDTFFITSALLFGPAPAALTIALDSLFISVRNKKNTARHAIFNCTSSAISLWLAAHAFFAIAGPDPLIEIAKLPDTSTMLGLAVLAAVYFLFNSGSIATAVSLERGVPGFALWRQHFAIVSINHFAAASAAFFLIVLMQFVTPVAIGAVVPLLVMVYLAIRSFFGRIDDAEQHVEQINKLYLSTVSALSTAIEAKDGVTSDHIRRVQAYALGLADALAITDRPTLQAIQAAALLHDTGKIAVPEHILNKPGRLTPAEFETMKAHVEVGADILSSIEFPYPVVPIVEAHHENWDGTGYPRGLEGEQIPIGARILSVVDCFDALTSDRPYRSAMSEEHAITIIEERSGTFYDPQVVAAFVRIYRTISPAAAQPQMQNAMRRLRRVQQAAAAVTSAERVPVETPVNSSDELLSFVSLARITSQTPTVGDVGALAWGPLRQIAPGATLALFTVDHARSALVSAYVAGPAAPRLAGLQIAMGSRVTGWAAANGRTMVNAQAHLDLGHELSADLQFAVAIPLVADGAVTGVMTLYAPEPFADDGRRFEMIAPHLAISVASALSDTRGHAAARTAEGSAGAPGRRERAIALRAIK